MPSASVHFHPSCILQSLTMISDSLTEVDACCDPSIMVKSLLHHWMRIFLSMEIDIQFFGCKPQHQQLQEESKEMVDGSPIVDDKITDQSLLMDCSTGATSVKKGLEKMNHMDSDFVNHPDWSTIVEILLLGLCRYTLQLDVNNVDTNHYCDKKESPITNITI